MTNLEIATDIYSDSCLRVEHKNYYVRCKGTALSFTRNEFLLVSCLVRNIDRVVPSEALWRYVYGDNKPLHLKRLRVYMSSIRQKFAPCGVRVGNLTGIGYVLSHGNCCNKDKGESRQATGEVRFSTVRSGELFMT